MFIDGLTGFLFDSWLCDSINAEMVKNFLGKILIDCAAFLQKSIVFHGLFKVCFKRVESCDGDRVFKVQKFGCCRYDQNFTPHKQAPIHGVIANGDQGVARADELNHFIEVCGVMTEGKVP